MIKLFQRIFMKRIISIWMILTLLMLSGCAAAPASSTMDQATKDEATKDEATKDEATADEPATEAPTLPEPDVKEQAEREYEAILSTPLQGSGQVEVEEMDQFPELPAGCESVALTIAINSYGYDLEKTDIADKYLIYGDSFVDSYVGDPRVWLDGAGIYPPGIVNTVWNFVEDTGARLYPIDTTSLSLSDLCHFIDAGYPVVAWETYYDAEPSPDGGYEERDGIVYQWFRNEHCVTLYGYDLDQGIVMLSDSVRGKVEISFSEFEYAYDGIGRFSVVMLDTADYDYPEDFSPDRYTYDGEE